MIIHLAEQLDVPLRDRNQLLLAGGYAPAYAQRDLDAPDMGPVRDAIEQVLRAHEPYPALVIDRHWGLVSANRAVGALIEGVADHLLEPPVNVLRLSEELAAYPAGDAGADLDPAFADVAVPLRLRHGGRELAFISTRTTFGTAVDVTVAELSIESLFPADATAAAMQALV